PAVTWQNGTVWYADQLNLNNSFNIEFTMNFGNIDNTGADGMVFVLQTVGTSAIGNQGFGLGYQGFNPSFGIEFDTFTNPGNNDPTYDHVAFQQNGNVTHGNGNNLAGPVQTSSTAADVEDGQDHQIRITWNPTTQIVELYVDCVLRLSDQNNLIGSIFGGNNLVYWGFTGSTGTYFNNQVVCMSDSYSFEPLDSDAVICAGESVQLEVPGSSQSAVTWSPALGLSDASITNPVATPSTTTTYCYTYYGQCNQTYTDCATITVEQIPTVSAGPDQSFCAGEIASLLGTCIDPLAQIAWVGTAPLAEGATTLNATVQQPGTFTITATTPQAQCSSSDDVIVSEIPLPVIDLPTSVQICPGESTTLDLGPGWDQVTWSDNSSSSSYTTSNAGVVQVTVVEAGCSNDASVQITEINVPNLDLGPDQTICAGNSTSLNPGILCAWSNGSTGLALVTSSPGLYWATHTTSGCSVSDTVIITTVPPPAIELGADVTLCEGETFVFQLPISGVWSDGSVSNAHISSSAEELHVTVTAGPCQVQDMVNVYLLTPPIVDMGLDVNYCNGTEHSIGFDGEGSGLIEWS
ncbi:MAG: lectin-like domain-containing protein, partial [Flavobacteriales bacterium]